MKIDDLIPGRYYVCTIPKTDKYLITRFDKMYDKGRGHGPYISNMNTGQFLFEPYSTPSFDGRYLRDATYEEIQWLNMCLKANRYIPLEQCKRDMICEIY